MQHIKYQGSRIGCFRQEDFLKFSARKSILSLCYLDMQRTKTISTIFGRGSPKDHVCEIISELD